MLENQVQPISSKDGTIIGFFIDIETFRKIEDILEDYGLARLMDEAENDESLNLDDAKKYLNSLIAESNDASV